MDLFMLVGVGVVVVMAVVVVTVSVREGSAAGRVRVTAKLGEELGVVAAAALVQIQVSPRLYDEWLYASGRVARGKVLASVPAAEGLLVKRPGDADELRLAVERLFMARLMHQLYGFDVAGDGDFEVAAGKSFGQMLSVERARHEAETGKLPS